MYGLTEPTPCTRPQKDGGKMDSRIIESLSAITGEEREFLSGRKTIDKGLYMDGSHDIITGSKLLEEGKQITIRPHTRFVHFPEHTHDYVEMVYMCQGTTKHIINGTRIELHQGELLMLGQNARQEIEPASESDIAVNLIVKPVFFQSILSFLGNEETPLRRFILDCLSGNVSAGYLYFQVADVLPVQNLIENLVWTMIMDAGNKRGIYQMTMGLLMAELMEHTEALRFASQDEEILVRTLRYIEDHYQDGSLRELSHLTHYDMTALSRMVRARTGHTYTELLQEKRLSQAAWFLRETDIPVEEIVRLIGYENSSYFHRLFLTRFGQSPKHFRDCK